MQKNQVIEEIDEDIICNAQRVCLTDYCYRQVFCGSKCLLFSLCIKTSNNYGLSDGDFSGWHSKELSKGMELIKGTCTVKHINTKYSIDSKGAKND